jgi:predicted DNA-binding transcriptional regulator YafY
MICKITNSALIYKINLVKKAKCEYLFCNLGISKIPLRFMNRIDRLSAILIMLQTRKVVTSLQISERFEISQRTVYRDIRALEEAGIPIGAEAGLGYYLIDGFHLPPVMFTKKEALAMITAEKLVEKFTDESINKNYKSALDKIKSVLPDHNKEYIEEVDKYISILHYSLSENNGQDKHPNNFLTDIQNAIFNRNVISIDYQSGITREKTYNRMVEPIGLCYYGYNWHLIGFCRIRNDYRDFRIDCIMSMVITDVIFDITKRNSVNEYFEKIIRDTEVDPVIIRVDKSILPRIERAKYYYGFVMEKEISATEMELSFLTNSDDYFGKWILTLGHRVEVVSPVSLKDKVKELVRELNSHYK